MQRAVFSGKSELCSVKVAHHAACSVQCAVCSLKFEVYYEVSSVQCVVCNVKCEVYCVQCVVCSVQRAFHRWSLGKTKAGWGRATGSTLNTQQFTGNSLQCGVWSVECAVQSVKCRVCGV